MFIFGLLAAIIGSLASGTGQTVQKYALVRLERDFLQQSLPAIRRRRGTNKGMSFYRRLMSPYWWTGIILHYVGDIGNGIALSQLSASVVAPIGILAVLTNVFLASQ